MNSFLDPIIILESISRAYLIKKTFEFGCSGVFRAKWTDFTPILGSLPEDKMDNFEGRRGSTVDDGLAYWQNGPILSQIRGRCLRRFGEFVDLYLARGQFSKNVRICSWKSF